MKEKRAEKIDTTVRKRFNDVSEVEKVNIAIQYATSKATRKDIAISYQITADLVSKIIKYVLSARLIAIDMAILIANKAIYNSEPYNNQGENRVYDYYKDLLLNIYKIDIDTIDCCYESRFDSCLDMNHLINDSSLEELKVKKEFLNYLISSYDSTYFDEPDCDSKPRLADLESQLYLTEERIRSVKLKKIS